jgi:hypothetical protein
MARNIEDVNIIFVWVLLAENRALDFLTTASYIEDSTFNN